MKISLHGNKSNSSRRTRRRQKENINMKLPLALLALVGAMPNDKAAAATGIESMLDLNAGVERRVSLVDDRRQHQQQNSEYLMEKFYLPPNLEQQMPLVSQRQLQQSSSLCSCSPTVFHLRLDFSQDCSTDTLKTNNGIKATLCLLELDDTGVVVPTPSPPDSTMSPVAMPTTPGTMSPVAMPIATSASPSMPPVKVETLPPAGEGGGDTPIPTWFPTWSPTIDPNKPPGLPTPDATDPIITTTAPAGATVDPDDGIRGDDITKMPSWSPTWSPTLDPVGDDGGPPVGTSNTDIPTWAPTVPWPTYSPTPEGDAGARNAVEPRVATMMEAATVKKQVRPAVITASQGHINGLHLRSAVPEHHDASILERYAGYIHPNPTAPTLPAAVSTPSYEPTTSWPTYLTPFPTDDATYAPTVSNGRRHLMSESFAGEAAASLTKSADMNLLDRWVSIPPNDEFFTKFPEFKARQEEIYQMRAADHDSGADSTTSDGSDLNHVQDKERRLNKRKDRHGHDDNKIVKDGHIEDTAPKCPETLGLFEILEENVAIMYYALVPSNPPDANNGLLCVRLEVIGDQWVGFGFSSNGEMVGSQAVIALPTDGDGSVLKYDLGGKSTAEVVVMDGSRQTLQDASVTQEGGLTTVSFAKLLVEPDEVHILENVENMFLYSRGSSNDLGYHAARMNFPMYFDSKEIIIDDMIPDGDGDGLIMPAPINNGGDEQTQLIPNRLFSAQFLEMDTSANMAIINQDDQYINVTFPPNDPSSTITDYTLSFTSISAMLDPAMSLDEQLEYVPGGVILILFGVTESGEVVKNRVMWTYTMGCGVEDVTVEVGDAFSWTMFDKLEPAREEFCPASSGADTQSPTSPPTPFTTVPPGTPTSKPVTSPPGMPTESPTSKMPSSPTTMPPKPSPTKPPSKPTTSKSSKPSPSSTKASKPQKSKSSKPGLSMPSGDIFDHFDLSKSAKSSSKSSKTAKSSSSKATKLSSSSSSSSSSTVSSSSAKSTKPSATKRSSNSSGSKSSRRRMEQHQKQQRREEVEREVFGRRISKHHEKESLFEGKGDIATVVKEPRALEFDRPLKRRLRNRSV